MLDCRARLSFFSFLGVTLILGSVFFTLAAPLPKVLPFSARSLPEEITLIVPAGSQDDAALRLASTDLTQTLAAIGVSLRVISDDEREELAPFNLVVGGPASAWIGRLTAKREITLAAELGEEGYTIQTATYRDVPFVTIAASGVLGQAYGLFHIVERLRLDPAFLTRDIDVRHEPAMSLRLVSSPGVPNYPSAEDALRWGFNAVMIEPWPSLPLYDRFDPAIFDQKKHPHDREWVETNRGRARQQIAEARRLHLKVVTMGDVFHLPRQALALYGPQVAADDNPGLFCIARAKTRDLLAYGIDEVLRDFPEIDMLMTRTGENYPLGPLAGNSPAQGACAGLSYPERLHRVIELIYQQVVEANGKTYVHRGWDLGAAGTHARPEVARAALRDLEGKPGLLLSFKHTQTDFWRFNPVNPAIGEIGGEQMVEFQMAREYEGKGAFPNYIGEMLANGAPEIEPRGGMQYVHARGIRAVWVWAKGGGWGGPYPKSDLWIEPNIYAAAHLAWDPSLSPETLAHEWATLRFGPAAAPSVARMLMKSDDAVLQAFYVAAAAPTFGPWTPHNLWLRDDIVYGEPLIGQLYQAVRNEDAFRSALDEKEQALLTVDSMIADLEPVISLATDPRLVEQALNTLNYQRSISETLRDYFSGMLYYYRWKDGGRDNQDAREQARTLLRQWAQSWLDYENRVAHLEGVATPYRDAGMAKAVMQALTELEEAS